MRDPRLWQDYTFNVSPDAKEACAASARTLGANLAECEPSNAAIDAACDKMQNLPWCEFEASFVAAMPSSRKPDWIALVQHCLEVVPENLDGLYGDYDAVIRAINDSRESWKDRRQIEPWSVWWEHVPDVNLAKHLLVRLLPQIDLTLWAARMEEIESPIWFDAITTYSHIRDDRDLLLRLVSEAPLVFEKNWDPTGRIVALVAAKWLVFYAVRIHDAILQRTPPDGPASALESFRESELPAYFDTAFNCLLSREDGMAIATHLSAYVAELVLRASSRVNYVSSEHTRFDIYVLASERLALAIRAHAPPDKDRPLRLFQQLHGRREKAVKRWATQKPNSISVQQQTLPDVASVTSQGEGARCLVSDGLPVWLAAFGYVYANDALEPQEFERLWLLLGQLLEKRDPSFALLLSDEPHSLRATVWMAHVLAKQESPARSWRDVYVKLEGQRRRSHAAHRYREFDEQHPSWVLLRVGVAALDLLPGDRQPKRVDLFSVVELAARREWLTLRPEFRLDWRLTYARCVATAFTVFESTGAEKVAELWRRLASSGWLICVSATMLQERGVPVATIDGCARDAGVDLVKMLNSQREWTGSADTGEYPPGFDALLSAVVNDRDMAGAT